MNSIKWTPTRPEKQAPSSEPRAVSFVPPAVSFGILLEAVTPEVISEVVRDVLTCISMSRAGSRVRLYSPVIDTLKEHLSSALPVDFVRGSYESCVTWKGYWIDHKPRVPEGVKCSLWLRVRNPNRVQLKFLKNKGYPTPRYPDEPRLAPPGLSPMTKRQPPIPPPGVPSQVPNLYPWLG